MSDVRIVIGQAGWVWVGYYSRPGDGYVYLTKAKNVRRWESGGLGSLCSGPGDATLDPVGAVELHELAVVGTYRCDASGWEAELA